MQERCALVTVLLQTSPVFPVKVIRRTLSRLHLDLRGKFFAELSVSCLICLSVGDVSKIGMFSKIMVWDDLFLFSFFTQWHFIHKSTWNVSSGTLLSFFSQSVPFLCCFDKMKERPILAHGLRDVVHHGGDGLGEFLVARVCGWDTAHLHRP